MTIGGIRSLVAARACGKLLQQRGEADGDARDAVAQQHAQDGDEILPGGWQEVTVLDAWECHARAVQDPWSLRQWQEREAALS
jgi:hypothetical protein